MLPEHLLNIITLFLCVVLVKPLFFISLFCIQYFLFLVVGPYDFEHLLIPIVIDGFLMTAWLIAEFIRLMDRLMEKMR